MHSDDIKSRALAAKRTIAAAQLPGVADKQHMYGKLQSGERSHKCAEVTYLIRAAVLLP